MEPENKEILILDNRLNELREKLFENRKELDSFDFGLNNNNNSDSDCSNETIELENDNEKSESSNVDETIRADIKTTTTMSVSSLNEIANSNKSPVGLSDLSLTTRRQLNNLSIETLNIKTAKLIQKRSVKESRMEF